MSKSRLRRIPGKARRYRDSKSGKEYSRRQAEKIIGRQPRKNHIAVKNKIDRYYHLLDDYIEKQIQQGKMTRTKKGGTKGLRGKARESDEMKNILKDLKEGAKLKGKGKIKEGNKKILKALKKTTRRDGIDDKVIPGESPDQRGTT